ncbi:MAG TPA: twin-arginine translocase subunit TatC [Candidatus Limnocylindrales bacterium]|nr:twin-arginine translocase subunit TatC [Candidatus Limnocylindrales bacterium]
MTAQHTPLEEKTFGEHLSELRTRLMVSVFCVGLGATVAYFFNKEILAFLVRPLGGPLYYTTPAGGFDLVFKISLFSGIFIASPILVYQFLAFLEPVIPQRTSSSLRQFLLASWALLIAGAAVAYYLSLPAALKLLNEFSSDQVKAIISTKDYFSFVISYLGGFAFVFQLPVVMLLLNKITPLHPKKLSHYIRHVVLLSFIIAAILTPTPDPVNQAIMAAPLIVLYLLSIFFIWLVNVSKRPKVVKQKFLFVDADHPVIYKEKIKRHQRYLKRGY